MAYFDSPKNKAIWEREMVSLRQERGEREKDGFKPKPKGDVEVKEAYNPARIKINLEGLQNYLKEAAQAKKVEEVAPEAAEKKEYRKVARPKAKQAEQH